MQVIAGLQLDRRVAIMAIVNRTRDSFFDAGKTFGLGAATEAVLSADEAGADIIDIGGVPFSPDAREVSQAEEIDLVCSLIEAVSGKCRALLSVDTFRSGVAEAAVAAGAAIINDTSGLADPHLAPLAARTGAGLIVTHSLAAPRTHLRRPHYRDVVAEVRTFLAARVASARDAGVAAGQLILDPGPDLNKNTLHTLELLRRFQEFTTLGYPVLAALSNKDFIGETLDRPKHSRLAGSLAAAVWCIERGARIVRVHDVPRHVEAVRMTEALLGLREPAYLRHNLD